MSTQCGGRMPASSLLGLQRPATRSASASLDGVRFQCRATDKVMGRPGPRQLRRLLPSTARPQTRARECWPAGA